MDVLIDALPVLAVGGFLWRQISSLDRRMGSVERGLGDVAQRLARLEGRIEGWQVSPAPSSDIQLTPFHIEGWQDRQHPPVTSS